MIFVDIIGVILLIVSAKTNKSYKFNKTEFDDSKDLDDLYYDFDEFIDVEEEEQQTESAVQSQNSAISISEKSTHKKWFYAGSGILSVIKPGTFFPLISTDSQVSVMSYLLQEQACCHAG